MIKQSFLLFFIFVCTIWNSTKAQSYSIESLEGTKVKIYLNRTSSWYGITLSCLTDTILVNDYGYAAEIQVLKGKFLEIVYNTRGGSGFQSRNTLILSVNRSKIKVSILVDSFSKSFGGKFDWNLYGIKFNIAGNDKSTFKLMAHIYERQKPSLYNRNKQVILDFDPVQNIFYSTHKKIKESFTIDDPKVRSKKLEINDVLPVIIFDKIVYYYIKGIWYKRGYDNMLFEEYYN